MTEPDITPIEELRHADLHIVLAGLLKAKQHLEAGGVRHTWLDPYIAIARDACAPARLEEIKDIARRLKELEAIKAVIKATITKD
jgi:hypothetical protein